MASGGNLLERADRIGLPLSRLAKEAGVHPQTVKALSRDRHRGPCMGTLRCIEEAVVDRELDLLDQLLPLHIDLRIDAVIALLERRGFTLERRAA